MPPSNPESQSREGNRLLSFLWRSFVALLIVAVLTVILTVVLSQTTYFPQRLLPFLETNEDSLQQTLSIPRIEAQEEVVMHFVALDAASAVLNSFPDNWGQAVLFLNEFARPGHTLLYGVPSYFGFDARRWLSVFLLLLTTAELIRIVWSLTYDQRLIQADRRIPLSKPEHLAARNRVEHWLRRNIPTIARLTISGDEQPNLRRWIMAALTALLAVIFFWWQPWVSYYGWMSLPATPLMYVLTAAVAALLQRRFLRVSLLLGFAPLLHHEAIFLLLLWFLYLYRAQLLHFFSHQLVEIFRAPFTENNSNSPTQYIGWLEDALEVIGKKEEDEREEGKLWQPLAYVTITLLPYIIWNFLLLAYTNNLPISRVVIFVGNLVAPILGRDPYLDNLYAPQNWDLVLDHAGYWVGMVAAAFFIGALLAGGGFFFAQFIWWRNLPSAENRRREIAYVLVEHSLTSRYTWWYLFLGYFLIETLLLGIPNNPFETNSAAYYLLPISPAVAIFAALPIFWIFENLHQEPIRTTRQRDNTTRAVRRPVWLRLIGSGLYVVPVVILFATTATREFESPLQLLPAGYIRAESDDNPEQFGDYQRVRVEAAAHEAAATEVVGVLLDTLPPQQDNTGATPLPSPEEIEQRQRSRAVRPIIMEDPVLRLTIEEVNNEELSERMCPRALWAQDTQVPFYWNLFPDETILILSDFGLSSAIETPNLPPRIRSAYRAEDENEAADGWQINFARLGDFRLQAWHLYYGGEEVLLPAFDEEDLLPAFDGESSPYDPLPITESDDLSGDPLRWEALESKLYGDFDPLQNNDDPNPGFAVYQFGGVESDEFVLERALYAYRYCGYTDERPYAVVDTAPVPVYQTLELNPERALIARQGSRLPALQCVRTENLRRDESFYCLVAFPDRRPQVVETLWDRQEQLVTEQATAAEVDNANATAASCYANLEDRVVNPQLRPGDEYPPLTVGCLGWIEIGRNVYLDGELPEPLHEEDFLPPSEQGE